MTVITFGEEGGQLCAMDNARLAAADFSETGHECRPANLLLIGALVARGLE